jgi:hypothetical protein
MRTIRIAIAAPRKAGQGFSVSVRTSASGKPDTFTLVKEATATIPPGLTLEAALDDPDQPGTALTWQRVADLHAAGSPVPREVGEFVYRLIARGKVGTAWREWRAAAEPCRTLLEIAPDPALARLRLLPWERMRDESGTFLSLDNGNAFARYDDSGPSERPVDWPLRVLIANCGDPTRVAGGPGDIDAQAEQDALEQMFASEDFRYDVEYDVLENPLPADLVDACAHMRPHVLHFIGHGKGGAKPEDHALLFHRPESKPGANDDENIAWPLENIRVLLKDKAPRLAFLNACRTSAGAAGPALVSSASSAFLRAGSAATIGMQGDIDGKLALAFSLAFYRGLITRPAAPLDITAQAAREAILQARNSGDLVGDADWSLPVLTLRTLPEQVLPAPPGPKDSTLAPRFVARVPQRRLMHEAIRCASKARGARANTSLHLAVIVGDPKSGKSHLSKWSAQACQRAGLRAVVVEFDEKEPVDWLDALRHIRDGQRRQRGSPPQARKDWALPAQHFRDFNWGLNQRQRGFTQFPPAEGVAVVADDGQGLADAPDVPENFFEDTMAQFRDALSACAQEKRLVLVLDQLAGIEATALSRSLVPGLLRPIASGAVEGVRLILVLTKAQYAECSRELQSMTHVPEVVTLDLFRNEDFDRVARHLCHQWSTEAHAMMGKILPNVLGKYSSNGRWSTDALMFVDGVCKQLAMLP